MNSDGFAVFLSYNREDHDVVQRLAMLLEDTSKLRTWFDDWSLVIGEPWERGLERGLKASRACAVCVGVSGTGPWQTEEVYAALRRQVADPNFHVIPVLLPGAPNIPELPAFLAGRNWVDFRPNGMDDDFALYRLECGILGKAPGRGRTATTSSAASTDLPSSRPLTYESPIVDGPVVRPSEPARVFISYRHQEPDASLASAFNDVLLQAGHEVFIDTGIRWGADWVRDIQKFLGRADFLLLFLSPESITSEMVLEEVAVARELALRNAGRPRILPIRVQWPFGNPLPYRLSAYLRKTQQVLWNGPNDTGRIARMLLEVLSDSATWDSEVQGDGNEGATRTVEPLPAFDPRDLILPGSTIEANSRFYVLRDADEQVFGQMLRPRGIVTIRGPLQTGKTSLIMGTFAGVRQTEKSMRAVFIDFHFYLSDNLETDVLQTMNSAWKAIASDIAEQLQLDWDGTDWKPNSGYDHNMNQFLKNHVFRDDQSPLVLCMDAVDTVFQKPIQTPFFASVRSFWGMGAYDKNWSNVRWILSTSSEPSLFIEDLAMSPFNIGLCVQLAPFTESEVGLLATRHGLNLSQQQLVRILGYLGGRAYLTHKLCYELARNPSDAERFFDPEFASGGIFRDHLHHYLIQLQKEEALGKTMLDVINGVTTENNKALRRLEAGGLIVRDEVKHTVRPACELYATFFSSELQ